MKKNDSVISENARSRGLFVGFGSTLSTLILAAASMVGPGCPQASASIGSFPGAPVNETTWSMGVFRIVVDPAFYYLLNVGTATYAYPGWNGTRLTSPVLYDSSHTALGLSQGHTRLVGSYFPVTVGVTAGGVTSDIITSYGDYSYPSFAFLPGGNREILTEIQKFTLTMPSTNCVYPGTIVPPPSLTSPWNMVIAGFDNGIPTRSIGMVQSLDYTGVDDFPAQSFFDVFVNVNLPAVPGTMSVTYFPPGFPGAVLYNDVTDPLIIVNPNLPDGPSPLPPSVTYIHDNTTFAVPVKFKYNNGTYWSAGQVFGYLVLAGHGLFDPCSKNNQSDFIAQTLGTVNHSAKEAPVGVIFPSGAAYPPVTGTYGSTRGTNAAGQSLDSINYTNGGVVWIRDAYIFGFSNAIPLPPLNGSANFTQSNVVVTLKTAFNATNYSNAQATGAVQILIVNTNPPLGGVTKYYTEILALDLRGSGVFGSFNLRESPTKASVGQLLVKSTSAGDLMAGSFDWSSELSVNNGASWAPANRPLALNLENPSCGSGAGLSVAVSGSSLILTWYNTSYRLQGTDVIAPANWVDLGLSSPATVSTSGPYHYFRLVCP